MYGRVPVGIHSETNSTGNGNRKRSAQTSLFAMIKSRWVISVLADNNLQYDFFGFIVHWNGRRPMILMPQTLLLYLYLSLASLAILLWIGLYLFTSDFHQRSIRTRPCVWNVRYGGDKLSNRQRNASRIYWNVRDIKHTWRRCSHWDYNS